MVTRAERIAAIDAFMDAPKRLVAPQRQSPWMPGFFDDEKQIQWPLEIDGEQVPDAFLRVAGRVRGPIAFRLIVLYSTAVCRLDFTDETHANPPPLLPGLPPLVTGPHYHSWPINRHFFNLQDGAVPLSNAIPYPGGGMAFDAILRWFCDDVKIEQPPPDHLIELPRLERLL